MIIRQALQNPEPNPKDLFIIAMHSLVKKIGTERALAQRYGMAITIAKECDCYFELDANQDQNKEKFLFWSKSLGENRPEILNQN